jgi:hypothetical protein
MPNGREAASTQHDPNNDITRALPESKRARFKAGQLVPTGFGRGLDFMEACYACKPKDEMATLLRAIPALLYDLAEHPAADRATIEYVLHYALLLKEHVAPDDSFGIKQFKRATLKARERLDP